MSLKMRSSTLVAVLISIAATLGVPKTSSSSVGIQTVDYGSLDASFYQRLPDLNVEDEECSWSSNLTNGPGQQNATGLGTSLSKVHISLLPSDHNDGGFKSYPLVVTPASEDQRSLEFLSSFMEENQAWISSSILQYGAVLFRGFDVKSAQDVEDAVLSYEPGLSSVYRGTSPRHSQGGSTYVFSAAEVPSHYPIAQVSYAQCMISISLQ